MATTKPTTNNTTRSSKLPVRRTSASTASIISSMTTVMPITTNRNSLPALAETTRRATHVTRNVQCTHLTTTRLFTREFRCGICFREGSFGWVWRCTQDRELMLEDDMDHGHASQEKLDDLCDIFPRRTAPRPRGPEARKSRLSFLDEISNKDLKTYTPAQIQTILRQRSHLLDVLTDSEEPELTPSNSSTNIPRFLFNPFSRPSLSTAQTVPNMRVTNPRPWLPSRGTECQFKCCHTCRPTLLDRSFLSLNAILDDDLPCTAITGFGFNLQKFRPVAKVEVVKNLGLRPNPVPVEVNPSRSRSRNLRYQKRAANLSLGILTHRSNATPIPNNPNYNSSPSPTDTCNPSYPARNSFPRSDIFSNSPSSTPGSFPTSSSETTSTSSESSAYPFPYIAMSGPTYQSNNITNPFTSNSNIPQNHAVLIPLPPQTPSEVSLLATPTTPTLMEESESDGHFFGAEPLEVEDGVAVMEEGVGLHVPDVLITQY